MDENWIRRILGRFYNPKMESGKGIPRELTRKERRHRKSRNQMAKESRKRNRT